MKPLGKTHTVTSLTKNSYSAFNLCNKMQYRMSPNIMFRSLDGILATVILQVSLF
jgi:hypothetical protein